MKLKCGLIGLGQHGRNAVAPAFYQDGVRAELAAVCDLRPEAVEVYDRPVTGKFTDYHTMLRDGELDAVYVAAGMDLHFGIVMDCLFAGVVSDGRTESTIMATGDDGYWAQYATEAANASAMKHRMPLS